MGECVSIEEKLWLEGFEGEGIEFGVIFDESFGVYFMGASEIRNSAMSHGVHGISKTKHSRGERSHTGTC